MDVITFGENQCMKKKVNKEMKEKCNGQKKCTKSDILFLMC